MARKQRQAERAEKLKATREVEMAYIADMAHKSHADHEATFSWEERQISAARAYWSTCKLISEDQGSPVGVLGCEEGRGSTSLPVDLCSTSTTNSWSTTLHALDPMSAPLV